MQYLARNRDSFIDQINPFTNSIFQHAVMQGDMAIVALMLKHGTVLRRNERNRHGLTALQQSVLDSNCRLALRLLESGADLEAKTSNGWTSLHIAAATGDMNMIHLLLTHCADVVALTNNDELPIDLAMNADLKVTLAKEMSRCGYIELSQWYMGKMTSQDPGVVYIMSADSLLEIACVSPEQYTADNCVYYQPNALHAYSSMINLPKSNDANRPQKTKTRKGSVWSLSQQHTNQQSPHEDSCPRPVPRRNKSDQECKSPNDSKWISTNEHLPKSFSSGYLSENADMYSLSQQPDISLCNNKVLVNPRVETDCLNEESVCIDQHSSMLISNVTETGTMRRIRRKVSTKRKDSDSAVKYPGDWMDEAIKPVQVNIDYYYQASMDHDGYYAEDDEYIEFKASGRPRVSSSASDTSSLGRRSVYVSSSGSLIEYSDTNIYSGDKTLLSEFAENVTEHDEGSTQLQLQRVEMMGDSNDRYVGTNFVGSSTEMQPMYEVDYASENSGIQSQFVPNQDTVQYQVVQSKGPTQFVTSLDIHCHTSPDNGPVQNNHQDLFRENNRLSGQSETSSKYATSASSIRAKTPALFEIDTDNIDDIPDNSGENETQLGQVEAKLRSKSLSELEDEDATLKDSNMYFNPMYTSVDNSSNDSPEKQSREITQDPEDISQNPDDIMMRHDAVTEIRNIRKQNNMKQSIMREEDIETGNMEKGHVKERNRILFRNEDEFKDVKRKKRGLLSELVSKFKETVKVHRASSDVDLSADEAAVVKRNSGKSKALRRRRHVRRSNSFSSYFPPVSDKHGSNVDNRNGMIPNDTQGDRFEHERDTLKDKVGFDSERNENSPNSKLDTRPYSTHRKDRSPLSQRKLEDNTHVSKRVPSPNCKNKNMQNYTVANGKMNGKIPMRNGDSDALYNNRINGFGDNGGSRIPKRSVNTYSKGVSVLDDCPKQNDNGCMSMKFLCK